MPEPEEPPREEVQKNKNWFILRCCATFLSIIFMKDMHMGTSFAK